jgi:hypothetical protein
MKPTPLPVALRAYTVRRSPQSDNASGPPSGPKGTRTRRPDPRWPKAVLVFDTETRTDEGQALSFGSYRYSVWQPDGSLRLLSEGLFHADNLNATDPKGMATLEAYASARGLPLKSRREFVTKVFWPVAIAQRGMVVGFNLPFDLSRIAIESGEAHRPFYGGFSLALWDYWDAEKNEWRENPHRPRLRVKSLDSKRAFIGFARPMTVGEKGSAFRGNFLDVRTFAFALSATSHSLRSASVAFGVEHGKQAVEEHGVITPDYIDYNRRDVLATEELMQRLRVEFDQLGLNIAPTRVFSPASLAKGSLRACGLRPLREKAPDISDADLGLTMTAFYGGRAECRIRRVSVPVVTLDFRSMYPTVNCLLGLAAILRAERIRFVDYTDELRELLADVTLDGAFDQALWPRLACFAEIEPDGDILPVRAKYSDVREGLNIGVNVLTSPVPMVYAGPDLLASTLRAGKAPRIRRAWRLVGEGVQSGLQPVNLAGRVPVDIRTMDFFRTVIEERVLVKNSPDYSPEERGRVAQLLKILANSGSYGIFAENNRDELPTDETENITVFGLNAPFQQDTQAPEDAGEFSFPPVAALIVAGARALLMMLECTVTDLGGAYAFCDTDSMAIVATEDGGLWPTPGGQSNAPGEPNAIRALSWADVRAIRARFNALNPYDPTIIPDVLNIEDVNYRGGVQRQLFAYVVSAKRYALYSRHDANTFQLEKVSEHGLGHLMNPLPKGSPEKWPEILWKIILTKEFALPTERHEFLNFPAVSRVSVSTPKYFRGFLRRWTELPYTNRIKPYGFLGSVQVARFGHPEGVTPKQFHLLAPYSSNPRDWDRQIWTDTYSGREFAITTSLSAQPGVVGVRSIADILAEFLAHGETKSADANGNPAGAESRGLLFRRHIMPSELRLIGKEANAIEAVEAGLIGDWGQILASYGPSKSRPTVEQLSTASAATLAQFWNVSVRTVRAWRQRNKQQLVR